MQGPVARAFRSENLPRTILLLLCCAALILFFGNVLADALGVVFVACVLAFLVSPLAKLMERKLPASLAAALALVCVLLLILGALALLLPVLLRQLTALGKSLPAALERLQGLAEAMNQQLMQLLPGISLPGADLSDIEGSLPDAIGSVGGYIGASIGSLAAALYRLSLSAVLCCFLIADREKVFIRLELMIPSQWRRHALRLGKSLLREMRLYLRGQATIALCVGALAALGLLIVGVDGAILLGAFVGLLNMIPYFGPLLGGVPAVLAALGDGWQRAALAILVLFLVQQVDGLVISPRVMGSVTGFSPGVVLLALFCGAQLGGVWGLLLAMPALMAMRTLYRVFVQRHENN